MGKLFKVRLGVFLREWLFFHRNKLNYPEWYHCSEKKNNNIECVFKNIGKMYKKMSVERIVIDWKERSGFILSGHILNNLEIKKCVKIVEFKFICTTVNSDSLVGLEYCCLFFLCAQSRQLNLTQVLCFQKIYRCLLKLA